MSSIEPPGPTLEGVTPATDRPMLRLFRRYGRDYPVAVITGVTSSILARGLDLIPPVIVAIAIDAIFLETRPFALWGLPQAALPTDSLGQLQVAVGVIIVAFFGGALVHWSRNWGWNRFAQKVQHAVRTDTYDSMQRLDMSFFASRQTGEMMSILSNDVNRLERFLNDGLNSAFRLVVMVVGIGAILLYWNWQLAVVTLGVLPLIAGFTYRFVQTIQPKYARTRAVVGRLNSRLENNLGGIQVIKAANTESYESERVEAVSTEYFDANWDAIRTRIVFFPALRVIAGVGFVATFLVGGWWVISYQTTQTAPLFFTGALTPGEFVGFVLFTQRFIWPMAQFGQIINMYQRAAASAGRIFGLLDEPDRITEVADAPALAVADGTVAVDAVSFAYDEASVIDDVEFTVDGGSTTAIVGPTGAGKSTLVKLLLRLYDPDSGAIRIDGQDIADVSLDSLRQAVGYVSQDTYLFYGSVAENIRYGRFDATDAEVRAAAEAAQADAFIQALPDGYDTAIGERGVKLSGGQRQRLSLARAILRDPDLLILDEATASVDTATELAIQRSLAAVTAERTSIVIAHRLSTVRDADEIIVLDQGRVRERGDHEALLAMDGLYATMWAIQVGDTAAVDEGMIDAATPTPVGVGDD
ncbi:MAG: ABC transporter ATP-binding protein [Haloferacaceae archaeon]|nr:ABC transporter ATP-binding protein [Haloferacaceae archaeon]